MARFVNPYNFVPFGNTKEENRKSRETVYCGSEKLKTGWLTVELEVKTPLIIPDGSHPHFIDTKSQKEVLKPSEELKKKLHTKYDFFHVSEGDKKKYIVPGSELRGMIRSVYEAVTESCVPFLMDDKPISQRVPIYGAVTRRGLLEYDKNAGQWVLWNTKSNIVEANIQNKIDICIGNKKYYCGDYITGKGYVQCNVPVDTRSPYHVAFLEKNQEEYRWNKDDDTPRKQIASVLKRDNVSGGQNNPNDEQRKHLLGKFETICETGGMIPVRFFSVTRGNEKLVYMSNSSIGRIAQHRKWKEIIDKDHLPCKDVQKLCPACLLFGTKEGDGISGRVRISDALSEGELQMGTHVLGILGQPRTSAFEFYLEKPASRATYWNFDFYGIKVRDPRTGRDKTEYHDLSKAMPSGRKMYWHGIPKEVKEISKFNSTMESVDKGKFSFKLYFDRITQEQLDSLIWVLSLGENLPESNMWHKLGHAKPLGYGSVKLCVKEQMIRTVSTDGTQIKTELIEIPVKAAPDMSSIMIGKDTDSYRSLIAMCDSNSVKGKEVRYPQHKKVNRKTGVVDDNVYQWFSYNHQNADRVQVLPAPYANDITLEGSWNGEQDSDTHQQRSGSNTNQTGNASVIEVTITGISKKGSVFFKDNGRDGSVPFKKLNGRTVQKGEKIKVMFEKEVRHDDGNVSYFYKLIE